MTAEHLIFVVCFEKFASASSQNNRFENGRKSTEALPVYVYQVKLFVSVA
jgi:hypothetical protein